MPNLTKLQVKQIHDALVSVRSVTKKPKHIYLMEKIRIGLKTECDAINEMLKPPEAIQEYDKKRFTLCREYCLKDERGMEIVVGPPGRQEYQIDPKRRAEFDDKIKGLMDENKALLDETVARGKEIDADLLGESDCPLPKTLIPLSALPDGVPGEIIEALMPVLVDDDDA